MATDTKTTTADPINAFFDALGSCGEEPRFGDESATVRFDVIDGDSEHWYVAVDRGRVSVSHSKKPAESVIRVRRGDLEAVVTGRMNVQAAILRGAFVIDGSWAPVMVLQRALPSPPGSVGRVPPISSAAVMKASPE